MVHCMIGQTPISPESDSGTPSPPTGGPSGAGSAPATDAAQAEPAEEIGGRAGPEPTRYGDWEKNGRCIDF